MEPREARQPVGVTPDTALRCPSSLDPGVGSVGCRRGPSGADRTFFWRSIDKNVVSYRVGGWVCTYLLMFGARSADVLTSGACVVGVGMLQRAVGPAGPVQLLPIYS